MLSYLLLFRFPLQSKKVRMYTYSADETYHKSREKFQVCARARVRAWACVFVGVSLFGVLGRALVLTYPV